MNMYAFVHIKNAHFTFFEISKIINNRFYLFTEHHALPSLPCERLTHFITPSSNVHQCDFVLRMHLTSLSPSSKKDPYVSMLLHTSTVG